MAQEGKNEMINELAALRQRVAELELNNSVLEKQLASQNHELRLFKALAQNVPDGVAIARLDGTVIYANRAFQEMLGYGEELVGLSILDLHEETPEKLESTFAHIMEQGSDRIVLTYRRKDGSTFKGQMSALVIHDEQGNPAAMAGTIRDIAEQLQREQDLRTLSVLVENAPDPIGVASLDGIITYANPAYETMMGYDEGLVGQRLLDTYDEEPEYLISLVQQVASQGHWQGQLSYRRQDGSIFKGQLSALNICDDEGNTVAVGGIIRDITERLQWEAALIEKLRASEAWLQLALEGARIAVWEWNVFQDRIIWSEMLEPLYGLEPGTFNGTYEGFLACVHPDDRESLTNEVAHALASGENRYMEYRVVWPDGSVRWMEAATRVKYDPDGIPIQLTGTVQDSTARRQAEDALRASEERYRSVVDNLREVIFQTDAAGTWTFLNPAWTEITGFTLEESIGQNFLDFVHPDDRQHNIELFRPMMEREKEVCRHEVRYLTRDGGTRWMEVHARLMLDAGGNILGTSGSLNDVTLRKQAELAMLEAKEAAEAAAQARAAFVANMSHELRTPLNAIIGMSGLLLDTHLNEEQLDFAETIRTSSDTLLTLINDVLDFSKIEAGRVELDHQPFDLRTCVEEAFDLVSPQAAEKHLEMAYSIDEQTPTLLLGDVTRLRQVLVNLLSNAVKFTHEGEVVVTITSRQQATWRYEIQITVCDTGIGISQSQQERLFQSFTQGDTSVTRRYGGTGLGLAISKMLVELMGGHIGVESVEGQGTTFHFTIAASIPPGQQPGFTDQEISLLADKNVLIVDDNATNRLILSRQVQAWQMMSHTATSGPEALQLFRDGQQFDVAILDVQMPDMDGITLARYIREHHPAQALPIIVLTSVGRLRGIDTQSLDLAATLSKPLKPSQLHTLLLGLFGGHSSAVSSRLPPPPVELPVPASTLRILLAEDNVVNQKVALRLLARLGYRADVAANGLEVLDALKRQHYDVVLMDAQMPDMDGVAATEQIRTRWPTAQQPRIVAMTADVLEGSREFYLSAGMDDYISKPVRRDELAAALLRCQQEAQVSLRQQSSDRERHDSVGLSSTIDEYVIRDLLESIGPDGKEFLQEIIDAFLETAPVLLNDLRQAIEQADSAKFYKAAHTLKPGCGSLGATAMASLCGRLEAMSNSSNLEGAPALLEQVEAEYQRVKVALATVKSDILNDQQTETEA